MRNRYLPDTRIRLKIRSALLSGTATASIVLCGAFSPRPAQAACDATTAGVSLCSGTDASVSKTATGNLDLQFNNETVTTGGVTISGGASGFNIDLNVISAAGPNPITNIAGTAVTISSNGGNVSVNTIAGADVLSTTNGNGITSSIVGGTGNTSITLNGNVSTTLGTGVNAVSSSTGSMFIGGAGNISAAGGSGIVAQQTAAATSGNLTIDISGNIIAQTGASNGITARITSAANNADISVTHSGTNTSGLSAVTAGGGNVTVNTSKDIAGLFAAIAVGTTSGTATVNVSGGTLAPDFGGISANSTSGNIVVNMTGGQIGTVGTPVIQQGITAISATGGINITSTSIFAGGNGIDASGGGPISVQNNGAVTSLSGIGIDLVGGTTNSVTNLGSILAPTGMVITTGLANIFNSGTITGTGGTAIQFAGVGNTLTLAPTSAIVGSVLATGADTFQLGGIGSGSFNLSTIGVAQQYRGFSNFNVIGGTWTATGTFAQSNAWTVQGGTLLVTGNLAPASGVNLTGGILGGTGTISSTTIGSGGTLMPGLPGTIGTLNVSGNLTFASAAAYLIQVSPANAARTNITGSAALGGSVQAAFQPGSNIARSYDILSAAGGRNGTFSGVTTTGIPGFAASLSYTATDVFLNLTANLGGAASGQSQNQLAASGAINNFFNNGGSLPVGFNTLFNLTGANLVNALTMASGETAVGSQQTTFDAMNQFMGLLTDPFIAGHGDGATGGASATPFAEESDGANAYAAKDKPRSKSERDAYATIYRKAPPPAVDAFAQRWSVWAAGYGGSQTTDGNAVLGSNTVTSRIFGAVVGADYRFSPFTIAGFALAGGGTNFSIANALGTGRSDLFQAGAYLRHAVGPAYISAALAYGWQDITTDRIVTIAGVDRLRAQFNANAFSGRVEGGYRFVTPWMGVTPYAAAQFTTFDLPAYAEQALVGTNTFALAYGAKDVTASRSELGVRTDKSWAMQDSIFTLRGRFAWAHDFNTDRNIAATFQTLPGASFVVNGAAQAHDAALVTASAEKKWLNGWSAAATFEGEFSSVTTSYAGKGVMRYSW
jgi:uncharacterized protein with beta-barrel porin domain